MPSDSYINFLYLQQDVTDLTETHYTLRTGRRGRQRLGFLTRSAVIMLCAAWERYNKDLLLECVKIMSAAITDANTLPLEIRKTISFKIKEQKNELSPFGMAGEGWKDLWKGYASAITQNLNTPHSSNLTDMFNKYLGVLSYTRFWLPGTATSIDSFIKIRGEIAHKGSHAQYVRMRQLQDHIETIISNVIEIDSNMAIHLMDELALANPPWDLVYQRTLAGYKA